MMKVSTREEMHFILQAALGPFTLFKRILIEKKTVLLSLKQLFDRDAFVEDFRTRNSNA